MYCVTSEPDAPLPAGEVLGRLKPEPLPLLFPSDYNRSAASVAVEPLRGVVGCVAIPQRVCRLTLTRKTVCDQIFRPPRAMIAAQPAVVFLCYPAQRGFAVQLAIG